MQVIYRYVKYSTIWKRGHALGVIPLATGVKAFCNQFAKKNRTNKFLPCQCVASMLLMNTTMFLVYDRKILTINSIAGVLPPEQPSNQEKIKRLLRP